MPLALARQRLLTSTFDFYRLVEPERGPAGGFEYRRRQNRRGEEIGGIVPHVTLESIANDEPAKEEVLVDRPETDGNVTRVSGPFCVEATLPAPVEWEGDGGEGSGGEGAGDVVGAGAGDAGSTGDVGIAGDAGAGAGDAGDAARSAIRRACGGGLRSALVGGTPASVRKRRSREGASGIPRSQASE